MTKVKRVMLAITTSFSLIVFLCAPARARVKWWRDKKGVLHLEETAPATPNAIARGQTSKIIDRKHAGLNLGDDESAFKIAERGVFAAKGGSDGNYYQYTSDLPPGAANGGALFVEGRLALIMVEYRDAALGGWDALIKQTAKSYGAPYGDAHYAAWSDGATDLSFTRESNGDITCILDDAATVSKLLERQKNAAPKF
jgi:hypothetical protein